MSRLPRDTGYDLDFDKIQPLQWYLYVGKGFKGAGRRIMVFAHNIPVRPGDHDKRRDEWSGKDTWADAVEEFAYEGARYTMAFRYFVRAATGLTEKCDRHSRPEITAKVDEFLRRIAFINFIQELVKSEKQIAQAEAEQVDRSKPVNREILNLLGITHCICWGKSVYEYVRGIEGFKPIPETETQYRKKGFASCTMDVGAGRQMRCLKIFHPSMPGFRPVQDAHGIIASFLAGNQGART
jgi:hypothetical protein